MDAKYMVMSGAARTTASSWTFGWSGRLQYVAVLQRGDEFLDDEEWRAECGEATTLGSATNSSDTDL